MNITLEFIEFDTGTLLGRVKRDNILEALVPAFQADSHSVFMSKRFQSKPKVVQWKVEFIFHNQNITHVFLKPIQDQPLSFAEYAKSQSKADSFFIRQYHVVDVDFGFHSKIYDSSGEKGSNENYSSTLLPGELYKRRPCIVLSKEGSVAQVIPLTTQKKGEKDSKKVSISKDSFKELFFRYREKDSFALVHLIQTVSANRIFPPKLFNGRYSRNYASDTHKILKADQINIESALAILHSNKAIVDRSILEKQLDSEKSQKSKLRDVNNRLKAELEEKDAENSILISQIKKIGEYLDLGETVEDIVANFEKSTK